VLNRATPYHAPHSTDVAGCALVYGADDRFFQNLFIGGPGRETVGTFGYDGCTSSLEEYVNAVAEAGAKAPGDLGLFEAVEQPAYIAQNVYLSGAVSSALEPVKLDRPGFDAAFTLEANDGEAYLCCTLPEGFEAFVWDPATTASLKRVRIADAEFENPDGSPARLDSDILDRKIFGKAVPGPCACLKSGRNRVKVWGA